MSEYEDKYNADTRAILGLYNALCELRIVPYDYFQSSRFIRRFLLEPNWGKR